MPFHDEYLRRTPLELAFPDAEAAGARMAEIAREVEARNVDVGDPGAFAMLASVNGLLKEMVGEAAPADEILRFAVLLFHAYHHHRAQAPTLLVTTPVCRYLVGGPGDGGAPAPPAPAGYAQLPRHLFWIQGDAEAPAEAVDGFFWSAAGDAFHVLLAVGMRDGRPGLAVVPLPEAPLAEVATWARETIRPSGNDFATTLPGGELEGLHSFVAAGEVLKFAARLFAYLAAVPGAVTSGAPGGEGDGPAPSSTPYRRVTLDA